MNSHFANQMERLIYQLTRGEAVKFYPPLEGAEHISFAFSPKKPDPPKETDMLVITFFEEGGSALVTRVIGTSKPTDAKRVSHIGALTELLDLMEKP